MRTISNANIEYLYLYKNKFNDFDDCLRMLYRTRLVLADEEKKENGGKILRGESSLYNIDLSNNDYYTKNIEQIKLIEKIIEESTLYCIDISHILYGNDPNRVLTLKEKNDYQNYVLKFKDNLEEKRKEYIHIIEEIHSHEYYNEKLKEVKKEKFFDEIENEINDIIKDDNSRYPIFLKERAKQIIIGKRKLFDPNNTLNNKQLKEIENKLVDYMNIKSNLKRLLIVDERRKEKKLILI
jgi:DNA-directed RNA polymerase subunit K/omega